MVAGATCKASQAAMSIENRQVRLGELAFAGDAFSLV